MKHIKIIEERPILHKDTCEKIVKIFAKRKLKITVLEARHLWDLLAADRGTGWLVKLGLSDKEIFEAFKPYYFVDNS